MQGKSPIMYRALRQLIGKPPKELPSEPTAAGSIDTDGLPRHWWEHPIFIGADEVVNQRHEIERALAMAVRSTRAEGEALAVAFHERPPKWPQYNEARAWLSEEGAQLWWDVYWEMAPSEDGIQLLTIETLRARAQAYGVKGRSKAEIAKRLRAAAPSEAIAELEREGRTSWETANRGRELRKFYEVLAHGVAMASGSISNVRAMHANGFAKRIKWTSGPCCSRCSAADGMTVMIGHVFPHVGVRLSPAHPGCCCIEIAEIDF